MYQNLQNSSCFILSGQVPDGRGGGVRVVGWVENCKTISAIDDKAEMLGNKIRKSCQARHHLLETSKASEG